MRLALALLLLANVGARPIPTVTVHPGVYHVAFVQASGMLYGEITAAKYEGLRQQHACRGGPTGSRATVWETTRVIEVVCEQ